MIRYYKDRGSYISYDAPYFNSVLKNILLGIGHRCPLNIDEIGVVEFVIPDFDVTAREEQMKMKAGKLITDMSGIIFRSY